MADFEKVIKGLKCISGDRLLCKECAYSDKTGFARYGCQKDCAKDALELLKKLKEDNVRLDRENQKLIEQMAQQPQDDANDDDDYDPCYECRGLGDDYIINDDGELESWCDKCGVNPDRMKDKE